MLDEIIDFKIFFKNTFQNILNRFQPKKFDQNFLTLPFFHYFGKKWLSPRKKFCNGKNFPFRDFWFRIRFEIFRIDSDQKNFDQIFLILSFFHHFWPKTHVFWRFYIEKKIFFLEIFFIVWSTLLQKFWAIIGLSSISELSRLSRFSAFFVKNAQK